MVILYASSFAWPFLPITRWIDAVSTPLIFVYAIASWHHAVATMSKRRTLLLF